MRPGLPKGEAMNASTGQRELPTVDLLEPGLSALLLDVPQDGA